MALWTSRFREHQDATGERSLHDKALVYGLDERLEVGLDGGTPLYSVAEHVEQKLANPREWITSPLACLYCVIRWVDNGDRTEPKLPTGADVLEGSLVAGAVRIFQEASDMKPQAFVVGDGVARKDIVSPQEIVNNKPGRI